MTPPSGEPGFPCRVAAVKTDTSSDFASSIWLLLHMLYPIWLLLHMDFRAAIVSSRRDHAQEIAARERAVRDVRAKYPPAAVGTHKLAPLVMIASSAATAKAQAVVMVWAAR